MSLDANRAFGDRVKFTTATTGQGTITVGSRYDNTFLLPAEAGFVAGKRPRMLIREGDDFEIVLGTAGAGATTLSRDTVEFSKIGASIGTTKMTLAGNAVVTFVASEADLLDIIAILNAALRCDVSQTLTAPQKTQAYTNLGLIDPVSDVFHKADPWSVGIIKTGAFTVSLKGGTTIGLNGLLYTYATDTAVTMPGSPSAGTDYAIYQCNDGSLRADASFTAPSGYTAGQVRRIGGFHYAPGGNATGTSGGDTTAAINAYSLWDLKFRPSTSDPRGMTLVAGKFWCDIYLLGVNHHTDGTSKYGVTIADGSSPPKVPTAFGGNGSTTYSTLTWWEAAEVLAAYGKELLCYDEFAAAAYGVTENGVVGSDPGTTGRDATRTSKWGIMQATGNMWVWGRDFGGPYGAASWSNTNGGRGQVYNQADALLFGGSWNDGAYAGSRASLWSVAPSTGSYSSVGARGRCDHVCHV